MTTVPMTQRNKGHAYFLFWSLLIGCTILYIALITTLGPQVNIHVLAVLTSLTDTVITLFGADSFEFGNDYELNLQGTIFVFLLALLAWWRIVKVFIFAGSPWRHGMVVGYGRQDDGSAGRPVTFVHLGLEGETKDEKTMWYCAIFRSHPSSDKIVRARLEFLILGLRRKRVLVISESRFSLDEMTHEERWRQFNDIKESYATSGAMMPPGEFRRTLVDSLREISEHQRSLRDFVTLGEILDTLLSHVETTNNALNSIRKISEKMNKRVFQIKGLTWELYSDGESGRVYNDNFHEVNLVSDAQNGKYKATQKRGRNQVDAEFASFAELREYVESLLA